MNKKFTIYVISIRTIVKIAICIVVVCAILIGSFAIKRNKAVPVFNYYADEYTTVMKRDLLCLMIAYWEYAKGIWKMPDGSVYLVMNSGKYILYDDKKYKTDDERLVNSDLQDMMEEIYPLYGPNYLNSIDNNPGGYMAFDLFKDVYGSTKQEIEANLVSVKFGNSYLKFNKNNGASAALMRVNSELMQLTQTRSDLAPFVYPSSGTYNYRLIAGTNVLSSHSFGSAIDLAAKGNDYWMWASRTDGMKRMSTYPSEVVKIFEKNNFIWGGRWGYFDMMHYEYRPDQILKAKYFSKMPPPGQSWYYGAPYSADVHVRNYVKMINEAIK